jgi:hypothetical protein
VPVSSCGDHETRTHDNRGLFDEAGEMDDWMSMISEVRWRIKVERRAESMVELGLRDRGRLCGEMKKPNPVGAPAIIIINQIYFPLIQALA